MSRKLITFDWAIKKLLRSKANFGILEGFLSELFFADVTILEILESESNKETDFDKYNRVDIKVKDAEGRIILVEVQYDREYDFLHRMLYGSAKTIAEHMKSGDAYAKISKVISVNILYFDFGGADDYVYHGTTSFMGIHTHQVLELSEKQRTLYDTEKIADICPEYYLIDVKNFNDVACDTLDQWIYFLKNAEIKPGYTAKGLAEANEKLEVMRMNIEERRAYDAYQEELHHRASQYEGTFVLGKIEGLEEGLTKGREEGREDKDHEIVRNGIAAGLTPELLSQLTGRSVEWVLAAMRKSQR